MINNKQNTMKKLYTMILLLAGFALYSSAADVKEAWAVDMAGANTEKSATLRSITYSYDEETKIYTFNGLIADGADVQFHIANAYSTVNNILFDNGAEAEESPLTWLLPNASGANDILVAVYSHQDYTNANLRSFQTSYNVNDAQGYLVILNAKRSSISRVIKFGTGKYGEEVIEEVASIAEFKSKAQASKMNLGYNTPAKVYTIKGDVTCIVDYMAGNSWYYVQDETGTLAIYTNHSFPLGTKNYKAGDVLKGITGFSVGSGNDGYYMDLEDEQFYVYDTADRDPALEYTKFPAKSGTAEVAAPKTIIKKSEVTRSMNHDYVCLKGFTYSESKKDNGVFTLDCLKDSDGNYFELSFDYVMTAPTNDTDEAVNRFKQSVTDGYNGDFTGFISNSTKNFMICSWKPASSTSINAVETVSASDNTIYNLAGQRIQNAKKGLFIKNGKKVRL